MIQYLIAALINFLFSGLALRRTNDRAAMATAFCTLCLGLWALELYFLSSLTNLDLLYPLFYLTRFGMFFIPFSFALFAYRILSKHSKPYRYSVLVPGFVSTALLCLANVTIFPSTLEITPGGYLPNLDVTYYWFLANFAFSMLAAIIYCVASYRAVAFREKQKIQWLLATLGILLLIVISATFFFTQENYLAAAFAAAINVSFAITFFSTSSNERLLNLKLAITEGISKLILLSAFAYSFFLLIQLAGGLTGSIGSVFLVFLFVLFITQAYQPLLNILQPITRSLLSKHNYDYKKEREILNAHLLECSDLEQLGICLNTFFCNIAKVNSFLILLSKDHAITHKLLANQSRLTNPWIKEAEDNATLIAHTRSKPNLALIDEVSPEVRLKLTDLNIGAALKGIMQNDECVGLIVCGNPQTPTLLRNEDLFLLNWLGDELSRVLERISRFQEAQEELADARKTISLIGVMNQYHHDIKTPLAIIDGVVSTDIYDQEKQRDIVLEQVDRGTRLIATMASILRGKRNRTISIVNINDIINDSLFVFEKRFHTVTKELNDIPKINGDIVDLKIMFVNVIKNSSEAPSKDRDLNLNIKTSSDDIFVSVSISDSGKGMKEEQLNNIWNQNTDKKTGSGVGLLAIKRIADEHQITVEASSDLNKGTTFVFKFPKSVTNLRNL